MGKKSEPLVLLLVIWCLLFAVFCSGPVSAMPTYMNVEIVDGIISPYYAQAIRRGNVYILTDNSDTLLIQTNNIVLDGDGYTLTGEGKTMAVYVCAKNVTIKNLIVTGKEAGIYIEKSSNVTVVNCTVTGTHVAFPGLQVTGGISLWGGSNNTIVGNRITHNDWGITIDDKSTGNYILGNNITDNESGIIYDSTANSIIGNNITDNKYGIKQHGSTNNTIYHNNINNTYQVITKDTNPGNIWEYNGHGNYWSDYNGTDTDGDCIGNEPHVIDENNTDNYPLMKPYFAGCQFPDITPPTINLDPPQNTTYTTNTVTLNFTVNEETSWIGYSLDGKDNITLTETTLNLTELANGVHNVTFYATDTSGNTGKSETFTFTVAETAEPESMPPWTTAVIVVVVLVILTVSILVYLKKMKRKPSKETGILGV